MLLSLFQYVFPRRRQVYVHFKSLSLLCCTVCGRRRLLLRMSQLCALKYREEGGRVFSVSPPPSEGAERDIDKHT